MIAHLSKAAGGTLLLFRFWLAQLSVFRGLSPLLRDPDALEAALSSAGDELAVPAPAAVARQYNAAVDALAEQIRRRHGGDARRSFSVQQAWQTGVRLALACAACAGVPVLPLLCLSTAQFVSAPYSFFVNVAMTAALAPNLYAAHYLAYAAARLLLLPVAAVALPTLAIDWSFFAAFVVADLLATVACHLLYSRPRGVAVTLKHAVYGTANAKSYYWVMLPALVHAGFVVDLLPLLLAACLTPLAGRLLARLGLHWAALFYHQHRLAHLPVVYLDAHKFHHYLDSSTAFDAHVYGSGLPEEWSTLVVELLAAVLAGAPPLSINPYVLYISWTNKVGHTLQPDNAAPGANNHVDHHEYHVKNYGIYNPLLDVFFATNAPNALLYRQYQITTNETHIILKKHSI